MSIPNWPLAKNALRLALQPCLGLTMEHHNPRFDFDERALPVGAALLALAAGAVRCLNEKA